MIGIPNFKEGKERAVINGFIRRELAIGIGDKGLFIQSRGVLGGAIFLYNVQGLGIGEETFEQIVQTIRQEVNRFLGDVVAIDVFTPVDLIQVYDAFQKRNVRFPAKGLDLFRETINLLVNAFAVSRSHDLGLAVFHSVGSLL